MDKLEIRVYRSKTSSKLKYYVMTSNPFTPSKLEEIQTLLSINEKGDFWFNDVSNNKDITHGRLLSIIKIIEMKNECLTHSKLNEIIKHGGFTNYMRSKSKKFKEYNTKI